jgi:hypothetical protein
MRKHQRVGVGTGRRQVVVVARQGSGDLAKTVSRVVALVPVLWAEWSSGAVARQTVRGDTGTAVSLFSGEKKNGVFSFLKREKAVPSQESMAAVLEYYTSDSGIRTIDAEIPRQGDDGGREAVVAVIVALACALGYVKYMDSRKSSYEYGIERELRDFEPIRQNTSLAEEEKEAMRREAMRRIARAKRAEENFRRNAAQEPDTSTISNDEVALIEEDEERPSTIVVERTETITLVEASPPPVTDATEPPVASHSSSTSTNPGLLAIALLSVMADDVSAMIPQVELEHGRVLGCSYRNAKGEPRGKTLSVGSQKRVAQKSHEKQSTRLHGSDVLLAPLAPMMKSWEKKKTGSIFSTKYSPFTDLHDFVSNSNKSTQVKSDRDPFHALTSALLSFHGFQVPKRLDKYDPSARLEQIQRPQSDWRSDPIISCIKNASLFDGPKISEFMKKYDPLSTGFDMTIIPQKGSSEYSVFQALLNARPTGSSEYSIVHALLQAKPRDTGDNDDPWKALVDARPPPIKGEVVDALDSVVTYLKTPLNVDFSKYDMIHNIFGHENDKKEEEENRNENDSIEKQEYLE